MTAAALAGAAGSVFTWFNSSAFPDAFQLAYSLDMLAMIIIGGMGTLSGPWIGAVVVNVPRQTLLKLLPQGQPIVIGLLVILIALFLPGGIVGIIRKYIPEARRYLE